MPTSSSSSLDRSEESTLAFTPACGSVQGYQWLGSTYNETCNLIVVVAEVDIGLTVSP